jgi:hypothetical protein
MKIGLKSEDIVVLQMVISHWEKKWQSRQTDTLTRYTRIRTGPRGRLNRRRAGINYLIETEVISKSAVGWYCGIEQSAFYQIIFE